MERYYMVLDEQEHLLAKAVLESSLEGEVAQFRILEEIQSLECRGQVELVGGGESDPDFLGTIERRKGERILVRPTAPLGPETRKNLRIETSFRSLLYPISGTWKGRRFISAVDISCGGIAFYCAQPLEVEEVAELVLPITDEPLLLPIQILRIHAENRPIPLYAAKFVNLIHDEEALIRKAIFGIQRASR